MTADPSQLKKTKEWSTSNILFSMERVAGTSRLLFGSSDFKMYEIDMAVEKPEPVAFNGEGHQSYVTGVALAAAAGVVVSGSYDGRLIWWNAEKKEQVRAVDAHEKWIRGVFITPDEKTIVSIADDMVAKVWDAESGALKHTLIDHKPMTPQHYPSMLYGAAFSPDGHLLATADKVGHIVIWETDSGKKVTELEAPGMYTWDPKQRRHSIGGIRSVAFSPDGKLLAAGGIGKIGNIDHLGGPSRVEIFDWKAGKRLHTLEDNKFKGLVEQIAFHESGDWFLAAGGDHGGFVTFINTASGKTIKQEKAPMHVHEFAFDESFETLYTVGHGKIAVWELRETEDGPVEAPVPA